MKRKEPRKSVAETTQDHDDDDKGKQETFVKVER